MLSSLISSWSSNYLAFSKRVVPPGKHYLAFFLKDDDFLQFSYTHTGAGAHPKPVYSDHRDGPSL